MKIVAFFFFLLMNVCYASGKEKTYIGSTPANDVVKSFLGIPLTDSVDFIRWKFMLRDENYTLHCHYGIGKPNTNGFMNDGKRVEIAGDYKTQGNAYSFHHQTKTLKALELNTDLLHLLNTDDSLLKGNGGWSYTLNNASPLGSDELKLAPAPAIWKDSIAFEGRTPCGIPGVVAAGTDCYKLKWLVILYAGGADHTSGNYKILGTTWRIQGGKLGSWKTVAAKGGRTMYQLHHKDGTGTLYLLPLDERLLVFTDAQGKLLVGDEDFSYTLNRR